MLSRSDVARHLPLRALASAIGDAYIRHSTEPPDSRSCRGRSGRAPSSATGQSVVVNFPGVLAGYDAYTVKVNAKTQANPAAGLPFLRGAILLIDRESGGLRAILDSSLVTAMRTAAAGALGVTALARPGASTIALLGAGVQGTWHLGALSAIGRLDEVRIYDVGAGARRAAGARARQVARRQRARRDLARATPSTAPTSSSP